MKAHIYNESEIWIRFHPSAIVVKFDDHKFYKYLSGQGLKGVDFLVIDKLYGLFLIEIKNFRKRDTQPEEKDLSHNFYQKCEDTLHLIEIIYKVYQRKWWVKHLVNKLKMTFLLTEEDKTWIQAYQLYRKGKIILIGNYEIY